MKTYKPIVLEQMPLVTGLIDIINKQNPGMVFEVDFTLMNPVIEAINQMIPELRKHNGGEQCFECHCETSHDEECELLVSHD